MNPGNADDSDITYYLYLIDEIIELCSDTVTPADEEQLRRIANLVAKVDT